MPVDAILQQPESEAVHGVPMLLGVGKRLTRRVTPENQSSSVLNEVTLTAMAEEEPSENDMRGTVCPVPGLRDGAARASEQGVPFMWVIVPVEGRAVGGWAGGAGGRSTR